METNSKSHDAFRQELLSQLANNELEADDLRQFVASSARTYPDLFEDYQVNEILDAIEPAELDWNVGYFDRQRKLAQLNFAERRITHLIDVREYLVQDGVVGFAKASAAEPSYGAKAMKTETNTAGFTPGENLAKMVQQGSAGLARSALINELEDNRQADAEITKAVAWTQARVTDLFVNYEENSLAGKIVNDPTQWDADYYGLQTSYVNSNFSKARFEHLITVRNALRQRGVKGFERINIVKPKPQPHVKTSARPYSASSSSDSQPGFLRVALMAGGALVVLATLLISLL